MAAMNDSRSIARRFAAGGGQPAAKRGLFERLRSEPLFPEKGSGGAPLTAVIGVMSFLAVLALSAVILIAASAEKWTSDLKSGLTVQIKGPDAAAIVTDTTAAARALEDVPGVTSVRALSPDEAAKLLEPWLGKGNVTTYLNIPGLIELTVTPELRRDLAPLQAALAKAAPGATLDDHGEWHDRLAAAARTGEVLALAVFALIMGAACAISIFAARAGLAANKEIVALLHLVGATDQFVAAQVQRRFLAIGLRGSLAGFAAAASVIGLLGVVLRPGSGFLPDIRLDWTTALVLFLVPLALCLVTAWTARVTVLKTLEKEL
jgi:cell division transport system permease protein